MAPALHSNKLPHKTSTFQPPKHTGDMEEMVSTLLKQAWNLSSRPTEGTYYFHITYTPLAQYKKMNSATAQPF